MISSLKTTRFVVQFSPYQECSAEKFDKTFADCVSFMRRSIRKFNIPPRATPRAFELLKTGLFKFPPLGEKKAVQMPHQLVVNYLSSKTNFVFNQTL